MERSSENHGAKSISTLDSHPEVKERRATQVFPASGCTKLQATSFAAYDWTTRWPWSSRPSKFLPYDA